MNSLSQRLDGTAAVAVLIALTACGQPSSDNGQDKTSNPGVVAVDDRSEGTRRMAERLARLANDEQPEENFYASAARVKYMRELEPPSDPEARFRHDMALGRDLLQAGQTEAAIEQYRRVEQILSRNPSPTNLRVLDGLRKLRALAFLRLGEQENCVARHNTESCLVPIEAAGVHTATRGSRTAIREYLAALQKQPDDLTSIWLLNLAYMTVGEYPHGVPARWRIPPEIFRSDHDIGRFVDKAGAAGIAATGLLGGSVLEDLDGDGFLDVMASSWGARDQLRLFRSRGDGTFEERTAEAGLTGIVGGLNLVHADYDNDGDADVFLLRGGYLGPAGKIPNSLLRNNGDGTFDDVTEAAGLLDFRPTQTAAWGDYDNDGWLDLFVGNETTDNESTGILIVGSDLEQINPCTLFRNNGDGTFTDVAAEVGLDAHRGIVKAVVWGDVDNDGRLDLFLSRMTQDNLLYHNDGPTATGGWSFSEVGGQAGIRAPRWSFPAWFWDENQDGWLDLWVSGYGLASRSGSASDVAADYLGLPTQAMPLHLYRNNGDGTFTDVAGAMGAARSVFTMGTNFGDLDNDGWLDFYLGTGEPDLRALMPNRMFRNAAGEGFQDVTTSGGFGHLQKGHAISFGDVDNDGDQDIYAVMGGAYSGDVYPNAMFENPGHGNHWVTLVLEGRVSNRSAIGARIRLTFTDRGAERTVHAVVSTGGSFGSSSLQQELGLGGAENIRSLEINWPTSGTRQVFKDVAVDRFYRIQEDEDRLQELLRPAFSLPSAAGGAHHEHEPGSAPVPETR